MDVNYELNSEWRKVAATIYKKPTDSKVFGSTEVDVTDLEKYVSEKRKSGLKITLTHIFTLAVARGIKHEAPELNTFVRRGKIVGRDTIEAGISVLKANSEMSSVIVPETDKMNLQELADFLRKEIAKSRNGSENDTMQSKNVLASLPWPFRSWVYRLYRTITISWGISMPGIGLSANSFGSFLITNIGSIGLDSGFPALLPSSNLSFVLVMGGIKKKPVVINDEVVIRRMMQMTVVLDHRTADASHAGKMYRYMKHIFKHPELLEE
ncbi:MAG: 2-oxo acid dehydrogenase subunit E2 [Prolixibacteraceae bacterium]|jgi:pyruvate/2-oxoglutarate dehydrogenase complex dihydrolipoamide acyltransferase (E2) component|nr:2-oxo acid dehydrogenase subunit E2 [Prolixibacteraceae bacterium]